MPAECPDTDVSRGVSGQTDGRRQTSPVWSASHFPAVMCGGGGGVFTAAQLEKIVAIIGETEKGTIVVHDSDSPARYRRWFKPFLARL